MPHVKNKERKSRDERVYNALLPSTAKRLRLTKKKEVWYRVCDPVKLGLESPDLFTPENQKIGHAKPIMASDRKGYDEEFLASIDPETRASLTKSE